MLVAGTRVWQTMPVRRLGRAEICRESHVFLLPALELDSLTGAAISRKPVSRHQQPATLSASIKLRLALAATLSTAGHNQEELLHDRHTSQWVVAVACGEKLMRLSSSVLGI